jgi:hypothetical protein
MPRGTPSPGARVGTCGNRSARAGRPRRAPRAGGSRLERRRAQSSGCRRWAGARRAPWRLPATCELGGAGRPRRAPRAVRELPGRAGARDLRENSTCTSPPPSPRQAAAAAACSHPLPLTFTCTVPAMDAPGGVAEAGEVGMRPHLPQPVLGDHQA